MPEDNVDPLKGDDLELLWGCFGLDENDLLDMKYGTPTRFDEVNLNNSNAHPQLDSPKNPAPQS